jgi:hypothetical protein
LDAGGKAARHVLHEGLRVASVSPADQPPHDELGVGVQRGPRPGIPGAVRRGLGLGDVLLLAVGEGPNLVARDALGPDTAHSGVVEGFASAPGIDQQLRHRVEADAGDPRDGAQAVALAEQRQDGGTLLGRELVHAPCI